MEIWKDIKGYEGLYQISNLGNVKSLNNYKRKENKILSNRPSSKKIWYLSVTLHNRGNNKGYLIHRLIALHFIPNPENKKMINHKNGIKNDNRIENLEWVTCKENIQHAYDTGLKTIGENHIKRTKETHSKKVINIETNQIFNSCTDAGLYYKINKSFLSAKLRGDRKNETNLRYL